MPIYEYRCQSCKHEFETIQKVSEDPLKRCPSCGQEALVKKISAAGFRLKGGGWYETDFKAGAKKNVAGSEANSTSSESSSVATAKDKPAEKPSEKPATKSAATD